MTDWNALIPDLSRWNNGNGIDPEAWIACEGSFTLAVAYSLIFWPEFVELDGMVFRSSVDRGALESWKRSCAGGPAELEALINHVHILDLHHADCTDASLERIVHLGRVLKEIYAAKLAAQFPDKHFVVEFFEPENQALQDYQLTFFQRRAG